MEWSEGLCRRLPDCPHFHVVFTVPEEVHAFFRDNYARAVELLFLAVAATLKKFQKNNWKMKSGFVSVLHTWGQTLNWHPHLHVLASSGGIDLSTGRWKQAGRKYMFAVKAMSKVFRGEMLRRIEELDADGDVHWPEGLESVEQRRGWRLRLSGKTWNIYSRPTLGNTRAVVRYLARYTSRIAMSNRRIKHIDEEARTVTFETKDYRNGGRKRRVTLSGAEFLRRFGSHLVPRGLRRVRSYGLLAGGSGGYRDLPGAPRSSIAEKAPAPAAPGCGKCGSARLRSLRMRRRPGEPRPRPGDLPQPSAFQRLASYSLVPPDSS